MSSTVVIIICVSVCALSALVTFILTRASFLVRLARKDSEIESLKYMQEAGKEALQQQIAAVKAEMAAQTQDLLKAREVELEARAKKTFEDISGSLEKDLKDMKESFERNKQTQSETSAALKTNIENAVKNLAAQTESIGKKADNLAGAMRGEVKGQGIWGETLFENMLLSEGFVKGRDYNREDVMRDDLGLTVKSEEGRGLRPDFVIHYPDNTDVIVDSKVSVIALNDYLASSSEEEKDAAEKRNYEAVWNQVLLLSKKDYARYRAKSSRKTLDYVLMFIPNYGALQLAKMYDADIWRKAFERNVLIVTEETAMPFLRMIRAAWASYDQVRNQKLMMEAAQSMLDRVSDFAKYHAAMGKCLENAREYYEKCDLKLRDSGKSIAVSARQVLKAGAHENADKPLPEPLVAGPIALSESSAD